VSFQRDDKKGNLLSVNCQTRAEIDSFWAKLTEGGEGVACWARY